MSQPFHVDDFSGGITDNFVDAQPNKYEIADNLVVQRYGRKGKLISRLGTILYGGGEQRRPFDNTRVESLWEFRDRLFAHSGNILKTLEGPTWSTISDYQQEIVQSEVSPRSLFVDESETKSYGEWKEQLHIASAENYEPVRRVYQDKVSGGIDVIENTGLPKYPYVDTSSAPAQESHPTFSEATTQIAGVTYTVVDQITVGRVDYTGTLTSFYDVGDAISLGTDDTRFFIITKVTGGTNYVILSDTQGGAAVDLTGFGYEDGTGVPPADTGSFYSTAVQNYKSLASTADLPNGRIRLEYINTIKVNDPIRIGDPDGLTYYITSIAKGRWGIFGSFWYTNITVSLTKGGDPADLSSLGLADLGSIYRAVNSYLYRIIYTYEYQAKDALFKVYSDYHQEEVQLLVEGTAVNTTINNIIHIPDDTWTKQNIDDVHKYSVEIYRTTGNGDVFYKVGEVADTVTTFNDTIDDEALQLRELFYTTDGSVAGGAVPRAKAIHIRGNIAYYGNAEIDELTNAELNEYTAKIYERRIYQSVPDAVDTVPNTFFTDVDDDIIAISSHKDVPIVLCKNFVYRINGAFTNFGQGSMIPVRISDVAGCVNIEAVTQTPSGLVWAGRDGFYTTDGYQVLKISEELEERYAGLTDSPKQRSVIKAKYDPLERRVLFTFLNPSSTSSIFTAETDHTFTVASGGDLGNGIITLDVANVPVLLVGDEIRISDASDDTTIQRQPSYYITEVISSTRYRVGRDPDDTVGYDLTGILVVGTPYFVYLENITTEDVNQIFVLHLDWGLKPDSVFTTWSNGDYFNPTAIEVTESGDIFKGDAFGYLYQFTALSFNDPLPTFTGATLNAPEDWGVQALPWEYRGFATSFNGTHETKIANRVVVTCRNISNLSMAVGSFTDDEFDAEYMKPIRARGAFIWADPDFFWGDPDFIWNQSGLIHKQRRFPQGGRKCSYKQMILEAAKVVITNSDVRTTATSSSGLGATVDLVLPTIGLTQYTWPVNSVGYSISFEQDGFAQEYTVLDRTTTSHVGDTLVIENTSGTAPVGAVRWVLRGVPSNEKVHLLSYNIRWTPYGRRQDIYSAGSDREL